MGGPSRHEHAASGAAMTLVGFGLVIGQSLGDHRVASAHQPLIIHGFHEAERQRGGARQNAVVDQGAPFEHVDETRIASDRRVAKGAGGVGFCGLLPQNSRLSKTTCSGEPIATVPARYTHDRPTCRSIELAKQGCLESYSAVAKHRLARGLLFTFVFPWEGV